MFLSHHLRFYEYNKSFDDNGQNIPMRLTYVM